MHVPVEMALEARQELEQCFAEAGDLVMGDPDFRLRVDSDIVTYPDHYEDPDGAPLWKIVCEFFGWDEQAQREAA